MKEFKNVRVMWLLNHSTLRKFEIAQLNQLGIKEIFLPKFFPDDEANLSASVDDSLDASLTIPPSDLNILNQQNWYECPSDDAWKIANKYFDIAIMGFFPKQMSAVIDHFNGAVVLRAFGLSKGLSYSQLIYQSLGANFIDKIKRLKNRFWFGAAYSHLYQVEGELLQRRHCFLPVGLTCTSIRDQWEGKNKQILFICPRINSSPYFHAIYQQFIDDFDEFEFAIGGAQPIPVKDKRVLGFISNEEHQQNMKNFRVMFYHSTEPNHIHYHPFEAIRMGMPLVFMAGGLLDTLGGAKLPGRCRSLKEAKRKIKAIFADDWTLINSIRKSQNILLTTLNPEYCHSYFFEAYSHIIYQLNQHRLTYFPKVQKKKIALILPVLYSGGSFRGAKQLANILQEAAQSTGEKLELVFAHLDDSNFYSNDKFNDLSPTIKRRTYKWQTLDHKAARRAMIYAGYSDWQSEKINYIVPDDGINQFLDCDLWIMISDRLTNPLLPIKPYICMVYNYLSRYFLFLNDSLESSFFGAAQNASKVLVTTQFTAENAIQYAGVKPEKIEIMPMLTPDMSEYCISSAVSSKKKYFLWTTNTALHKNHVRAFLALKKYYEELDGQLNCHISGCDTDILNRQTMSKLQHLLDSYAVYENSNCLKTALHFCGELSNSDYVKKLQNAAFVWHPAYRDNGTFTVIEAAQLGVPSLSSDYPAMQEINQQFGLDLNWMDASDPLDMALKLKLMEEQYINRENKWPLDLTKFKHNSEAGFKYWRVIKECL